VFVRLSIRWISKIDDSVDEKADVIGTSKRKSTKGQIANLWGIVFRMISDSFINLKAALGVYNPSELLFPGWYKIVKN
jgi:hypothetical protein